MTVALITGCSRGIGLATAVYLARKGFDVYASVRDLSDSEELREAIQAEGLPIRVLELDVTDEQSAQAAVTNVLDEAGHIDVLVNNAGFGRLGPIEFIDDDVIRKVLETNLIGSIRLIRLVLPGMRARRSGTIVNMSSVNGVITLPLGGPYFISKHALEAASEMLAFEVNGFGIRVAIIEPGAFATQMLHEGAAGIAPESGNPYEAMERRSSALIGAGIQNAGDPYVVAEVVHHAITTNEPWLRYLVGDDATMMVGARERISDEDWVALGGAPTDEQFFAGFQALMAPQVPAGR
jgi:NAD(P)-dependent dehydrogenase (short-subunit alcohol dehydrogenase family)